MPPPNPADPALRGQQLAVLQRAYLDLDLALARLPDEVLAEWRGPVAELARSRLRELRLAAASAVATLGEACDAARAAQHE